MNHTYSIAQPCSVRFDHITVDGEKVLNALVKPNTHRPFVLLDELLNTANFQECVPFYTLPKSMGLFKTVWKVIESTSSWAKYEYYLVAHEVGLKELKDLIFQRLVWPIHFDEKTGKRLYLPAFGDNQPVDHERCVTYNDTHLLIGKYPNKIRIVKRRDA